MVLGRRSVPGNVALAVGAGGGCLDIFLSSIFSLFSLFARRPDID